MTQGPDTPTDWPTWIIAICAIGGTFTTVIIVLLKSIFVTRGELKTVIDAICKVNDDRHRENVKRFTDQDKTLGEIQKSVARIEGQISGKYPRLER